MTDEYKEWTAKLLRAEEVKEARLRAPGLFRAAVAAEEWAAETSDPDVKLRFRQFAASLRKEAGAA